MREPGREHEELYTTLESVQVPAPKVAHGRVFGPFSPEAFEGDIRRVQAIQAEAFAIAVKAVSPMNVKARKAFHAEVRQGASPVHAAAKAYQVHRSGR